MNHKKQANIRSSIAGYVRDVQDAQTQYAEIKQKGAGIDTDIEKEFEPFEYREVIPQLHETIISSLPNEQNDKRHAALHKAFSEGRVEDIKKIPRKKRPQVFITNMSMYFTNDLDKGQFGGADAWRRSRGAPGGEGGLEDGMDEYEYAMMMEAEYGMDMSMYGPGYFGTQTTEEKKQGFVLTIIGYTPYGEKITDVQELLDPHGVDENPDRWGLVTRLAHLDDLVPDGNSPFKLYKKAEKEQFSLEIKEVDLKNSESMPPEGIGVWEEIITETATTTTPATTRLGYVGTQSEWELVDPMTRETINKIPVLDDDGKQVIYNGKPVFRVNDHWFVLNVKFEWTEAPEPPEDPMQSMYGSRLGQMGARTAPSSSTTPSSP